MILRRCFSFLSRGKSNRAGRRANQHRVARRTVLRCEYLEDRALPSAPTIGAFSAGPGSVNVNGLATLDASNVTDSGATVTAVKFYLETNGTSGLQVGSDRLVGSGVQNGTSWLMLVDAAGLAQGSYTYYAVASDSNNSNSATASAVLTVSTSTGAGFSAWSAIKPALEKIPVTVGELSNVSVVNFGTTIYTGPLDTTNTLNRIRADGTPNRSHDGGVYTSPPAPVNRGTAYEFTIDPATGTDHNFSGTIAFPGPMRFIMDTTGDMVFTGDHYSTFTTMHIQGNPTIGSFTVSPNSINVGGTATLTASNVTENGDTIANVKFYRESNGTTGWQSGTDTFVGFGVQSGTTWTLAADTSGLTAGTYTYYAVVTDTTSSSSSNPYSATLTINAATSNPTIGSFALSPSTITAGGSSTLTASNVTDTGGAITGVKFYRESNGTSGLQIGSDTLVGAGVQNGTTWTLASDAPSLSAGTYTYYAVATDNLGTSSAAATANLIINAAPNPLIGSFTLNPSTITVGGASTLTASNVTDAGSTITAVKFYRESNGTSGLQIGSDTLVGSGVQSGATWTLAADSASLAAGTYTYYAVATDSAGVSSAVASAALTISAATGNPTIGSFSLSPNTITVGGSSTLTASNVTDTGGTITGVKFYRESNGTSGLQIGSDTLVGSGVQSGTTWTLASDSPSLAAGTYTYYAVATDNLGVSSTVSSATLTINAATGNPTIGSFSLSPNTITVGGSSTLTASNVTDTGGTITGVKFYRESNGTSGLQIGSDTLVGSGTQSGTTWTLASDSPSLATGTYTYYAVATDNLGVSSAVASATLTINPVASSGVLLGWDVSGQNNFGTQGLTAGTVATGISNSLGLTRGSGVTTNPTAASAAWGGNGWASTSAAGISGNEFITFGLTVASGEIVSLTSLDLHYRHSGTGPSSGYWQYQLNGGAWNLIGDFPNEFPTAGSSSTGDITEINLSGISALQNLAANTVADIRLVPYAATGSGGTFYVYDGGSHPGNDLILNGSVAAAPMAPAQVASALSPSVLTANAPASVSNFAPTTSTVVTGTSNANNQSNNSSVQAALNSQTPTSSPTRGSDEATPAFDVNSIFAESEPTTGSKVKFTGFAATI